MKYTVQPEDRLLDMTEIDIETYLEQVTEAEGDSFEPHMVDDELLITSDNEVYSIEPTHPVQTPSSQLSARYPAHRATWQELNRLKAEKRKLSDLEYQPSKKARLDNREDGEVDVTSDEDALCNQRV